MGVTFSLSVRLSSFDLGDGLSLCLQNLNLASKSQLQRSFI